MKPLVIAPPASYSPDYKAPPLAPTLPSERASSELAGPAKGVGCGDIVGPLAQRYWKAPFRYDAEGSMIWDAQNERVLDVRGWGYLTGQGSKALGLSYTDAARIQDDFGWSVVALLNASWPNVKDEP